MEYDPAVRDRIEQLIEELRTAEDPAEKARVQSELDKLIFDLEAKEADWLYANREKIESELSEENKTPTVQEIIDREPSGE